MAKKNLNVMDTEISIVTNNDNDYISITDIAKFKSDEPRFLIRNWLRNRNTIEFLGIWESLYNLNFNRVEFDTYRNQAGLNSFTISPKIWIEKTNAIGIISKSGRYGGTFAHKDIAFKFANWISVEFELYIVKEFQRLKENELKNHEWNLKRTLSKINYSIHTDAIKDEIIPSLVNKKQISFTYASEADLLNVALFGKTAGEWRRENKELKGNIRDYATLEQLVVLSNMESINALLIRQGISQSERLIELNKVAISQMSSLIGSKNIKKLE
ncbi:MAG: KilA-N domain-containing protein [Methanobrevibacter sp.]|jgi:hypothetical protein|nr:KilA-N domain-containing protein [Candidatus Methanoflexus mossambicus]